ncbi:hypothetical protein EVAR_69227_1 [Eumeta japonica]|uniref:Uncharacterized protein n=1 Tax=Eumeta variegata TaxID=151549 RepID=A0A4C1TA26_EUMVA|nr:hypothetical protein EVAR_69227_1 [Eumeta japonica]
MYVHVAGKRPKEGCNRTYHGDLGRTYELELHRPREELVPFVCLITITAAGGVHGDLVQFGAFKPKATDIDPDDGELVNEFINQIKLKPFFRASEVTLSCWCRTLHDIDESDSTPSRFVPI